MLHFAIDGMLCSLASALKLLLSMKVEMHSQWTNQCGVEKVVLPSFKAILKNPIHPSVHSSDDGNKASFQMPELGS